MITRSNDEELRKQITDELYQPVYDITKQALPKQERHDAFDKIIADFLEKVRHNTYGPLCR